jgi:hypothetical protein
MKKEGAVKEETLLFSVAGIGKAAFDRADRLTSFARVKAHALGATLGIDHVDIVTLADCLVGALRLALAAIDAHICDVGRHGVFNSSLTEIRHYHAGVNAHMRSDTRFGDATRVSMQLTKQALWPVVWPQTRSQKIMQPIFEATVEHSGSTS